MQVPPLQKPERQSDGDALSEQAAPAPPSAVHFLLVSLQYALPAHSLKRVPVQVAPSGSRVTQIPPAAKLQ